jgi:integrase
VSQHSVRLNEAVESYLTYRRTRFAASTVTNESFVLRRFAAWVGRDIQLRHLRAEKVEEWFHGPNGLLDEHVTRDRVRREAVQPSTHNFYRNRLASFFRYCTQRGHVRVDLLAHVQPMKVERKQRQQPSPHHLLALLDATDSGRDRAYIATAINTALRSNEITRMRVGDVNLDAGWIAVHIHEVQGC